ncbi:MAG: phage terminase large subunit [Oscillospiraceae bacterium]|nr:phage terminase large subunit [Oscillospiraceae bacterium]
MTREITLDLGEPNAKQALFFGSRALYTAYGGAKGGGKTHAVRVKAVGGALRWPGIRILILRRTYPELQQNHIETTLRLVPPELASYNAAAHTLYFTNGSVLRFGHYQSSSAELEYQGQEYDWIFMDEATQFTERDFRYLGGCLRGVSDAPKRFYITCNPGGVGHAWVKRLFIDRKYRDGERESDHAFIFASVEDNTHLLASSPSYLQMLDSLPENLREAYRHGSWDALAGAYFSEFDESRHVVAPFRVPARWTRFRSFDYGLDMLACLWLAVSPEGKCHVYRELRAPNLVVSEAARAIADLTLPGEEIAATFAPPDMWSRQKDTGASMAELFAKNNVPVLRAGNSRVQGHLQIKEMLRGDGKNPSLVFFNTCPGLISDIKAIEADSRRPGDCARTPHDVTHAVDALRYFCSSRASEPPPPAEYETYLDLDYLL